jgi:hypothetical protein
MNIWTTNEDGYKWLYISLFNNHGWISSMQKWHLFIWNHSFMDTFIHVGGLNTLSFKLQAPSSGFTLMQKPMSHEAFIY